MRGDVIWVDPNGRARLDNPWPFDASGAKARLQAEAAACAELISAAEIPFECGSEVPVAPARGAFVTFTPRRTELTASGPRTRPDGFRGRRAIRGADAFDVMRVQAERAHGAALCRAEKAGAKPPVFDAPFTDGQVEAGRAYAALSERCAASGVKCSSLEAQAGGGGRGGDREVAMLRDFGELRRLHRRIGGGLAKEVRHIRPKGRKRSAISVRVLVDQVCIGGLSLSAVLDRHGWAVDTQSRNGLRQALCAALDRMRGYKCAEPQNVG